jgi:hypothetical protein
MAQGNVDVKKGGVGGSPEQPSHGRKRDEARGQHQGGSGQIVTMTSDNVKQEEDVRWHVRCLHDVAPRGDS